MNQYLSYFLLSYFKCSIIITKCKTDMPCGSSIIIEIETHHSALNKKWRQRCFKECELSLSLKVIAHSIKCCIVRISMTITYINKSNPSIIRTQTLFWLTYIPHVEHKSEPIIKKALQWSFECTNYFWNLLLLTLNYWQSKMVSKWQKSLLYHELLHFLVITISEHAWIKLHHYIKCLRVIECIN